MARTRKDWHVVEEGDSLTLSRALPVRFDLAVETLLPPMGRRRLAHQVRQDMWRALQHLRGFRPAVRVTRVPGGVQVMAGGAVAAPFARAHTEALLRDVLEDGANRARWTRFSGRRNHA